MQYIQIIAKNRAKKFREVFDAYLRELANYDKTIQFDAQNKPVYKWFDAYWEGTGRYPLLLTTGKEILGFAFVRELGNSKHEIAEFYIVPKFRKRGFATWFATELFKMFGGEFEFSTCKSNDYAVRFWDKISSSCLSVQSEQNAERKTWAVKTSF